MLVPRGDDLLETVTVLGVRWRPCKAVSSLAEVSAAAFTGSEILSLPQGTIAMIGFELEKFISASSISLLIHYAVSGVDAS